MGGDREGRRAGSKFWERKKTKQIYREIETLWIWVNEIGIKG